MERGRPARKANETGETPALHVSARRAAINRPLFPRPPRLLPARGFAVGHLSHEEGFISARRAWRMRERASATPRRFALVFIIKRTPV
jgi:hypothetical protein